MESTETMTSEERERDLDLMPIADHTVIGKREADTANLFMPVYARELKPYWRKVLEEGHVIREKKHL
jgi:hypothetical protein